MVVVVPTATTATVSDLGEGQIEVVNSAESAAAVTLQLGYPAGDLTQVTLPADTAGTVAEMPDSPRLRNKTLSMSSILIMSFSRFGNKENKWG